MLIIVSILDSRTSSYLSFNESKRFIAIEILLVGSSSSSIKSDLFLILLVSHLIEVCDLVVINYGFSLALFLV